MVTQIAPPDLAAKLRAGEAVYLLDVRQPSEYQVAALPNSVLIPLNELPARTAEVAPPAGALVVVYCHHGMRSLRAAAFLEQTGVANVASLAGGIDAWSCEIDPSVPRY
ncbi:MAG TPA: rhodanese-like domain-containing protein [Gemmataceae bacterium]|nr:rhodanese-like domain-containing protein [Gemmataceae bacterium]